MNLPQQQEKMFHHWLGHYQPAQTMVELEESFRLTTACADCMEEERDVVQKISDKNLKRVDVWSVCRDEGGTA